MPEHQTGIDGLTDIVSRFYELVKSLPDGGETSDSSELWKACVIMGTTLHRSLELSQDCILRSTNALAFHIDERPDEDLDDVKRRSIDIEKQYREARTKALELVSATERSMFIDNGESMAWNIDGSTASQVLCCADSLTREWDEISGNLRTLVDRTRQYRQGVITGGLMIDGIDRRWRTLRDHCEDYIRSVQDIHLSSYPSLHVIPRYDGQPRGRQREGRPSGCGTRIRRAFGLRRN